MSLKALEIGKRALISQRYGLEVTSNNIANANNPGFSRKVATFKQTDPHVQGGKFYGTGLIANRLQSMREEFFDREVRDTISREAASTIENKYLSRVENILSEPSDMSIGNKLSDFFLAWEELSINPESISLRNKLASVSKSLTDRFHQVANQIEETRLDLKNELVNKVNLLNSLSEKVANYNRKISAGSSESVNHSTSMIDEREKLLEEIAQLGKLNLTHNDDGTVNVYFNGSNLVTAGETNKLKLNETVNPLTGEKNLRIYQTRIDGTITNGINPSEGEISSMLSLYNEMLDKDDSSGKLSIAKNIHDLAKNLVESVNNISQLGYGLNDTGALPHGRAFFLPNLTDANAFNIEVNPNILQNVANIPTSDTENQPGNSVILNEIASIASNSNFLNGQNPLDFYNNNILSELGYSLLNAKENQQTLTLMKDQLKNQRESVIGVNLEEEAINLIKFQQIFEAASRIVNTTNEILGTVVNLGR